MAAVLTGHYDAADALSRHQQVFAQISSDLDSYNTTERRSPFLEQFTVAEFSKTSRVIRQAPKEFKADGEAGDQEAQRGQMAEMTFDAASYSVRTEFTEEFMEDASPEELLDEHGQALIADDRLLNKLFFISLLKRPTSSETSNICGFYYGQKDAPNFQGIVHNGSTHTHYLTTAAATAWAAADLVTGRNHITHHGWGVTNGGVTFMANTSTMDAFAALSGFSDQNITEEQERDGIVGKIKGVLLKEVNWIPNDYGLFLPTHKTPAVVTKHHFKEENRGLKILPGGNPADPLLGAKYKRVKIGFNVVLKGAGVVMKKAATFANQTVLTVS